MSIETGRTGGAMAPTPRPTVNVALAVVWNGPERVLICKRKADAVLGGCWEFPGGKCEPGESPAACALREVREETGLIVDVARVLAVIEHDYPHARVRLHPFVCRWTAGALEPREVAEARWVPPGELRQYHFPEANAPLLRSIIAGQAGPPSPPRP